MTRPDWKYKNFIPLDPEIERMSYNHDNIETFNVEVFKRKLAEDPYKPRKDWGILSTNKHRNFTYHFVITAALVARFCIEGGLSLDDAYTTSDYYIQKADVATTDGEIATLYNEMMLDYAEKMK